MVLHASAFRRRGEASAFTGLGGDLLSALKAFDAVTKIEPDNVIALTSGGWIRRLIVALGDSYLPGEGSAIKP